MPARRAVKVPPIEAVRRSNDITAKQVKIHGNGIVYKLFGFEGMIAAKNFRRNKKQYRTAILSLFMSVVLFVSASSFCRYLTDAAGDVDRSAGYDISYVMHDAYDTDAADRIYKSLSEADGVTESVLPVSYTHLRTMAVSRPIELRSVTDRILLIISALTG